MLWDADDDTLLVSAGRGDQVAFNRLVQRHAPRLHAVARHYGCSKADADEIVQDTFWQAWKAAKKWQPGRAKVFTWLYRLAANRTIDYHRVESRRRTDSFGEDQDFEDETTNPERLLADRQRLSAMQTAIAELPDRQRMAIILSAQQDKSNAEIAKILGSSEEAVEQLIMRARRTLRDKYRTGSWNDP